MTTLETLFSSTSSFSSLEDLNENLNSAQKIDKTFADQGYLILENFLHKSECEALMNEASCLLDEFRVEESSSVFWTSETNEEQRDAYFLDSGDKISFFWEKNVFNQKGELLFPKEKAINKIGHALHDLNPVFKQFSYQEKIKQLLLTLGLNRPYINQSMYIFKQPYVGGEVVCHQDQTYLFSADGSVIGLWFALEDAHRQNGCLWAIPGGHHGPLKKQFLREGTKLRTEVYDSSPWQEEKMIPLEVTQGSVIVLHGLLPHKSEENTSAQSRHAYTLHMMDESWEYAPSNWLQRSFQRPWTP